MTIVERVVNVYDHFKKLLENPFLKVTFYSVFAAFFMFSTFSVYAQGETYAALVTEGSWTELQNGLDIIEGVDVGSKNTVTSFGNNMKSGLTVVDYILEPDIFKNGEELQSSTEVSDESKQGLLDIADNGVMALLNNPPSTDVASHLAKEWIPGYSSDNSLYAVDGHNSGYDELKNAGIDVIWGRVRNIAYVLFVVVMIVIGFMIMFRSKINGQVMVTIGNAIPNIIIALVLVTFSFAIAGLIIDIGGIILLFIVSALQGGGSIDYDKFVGLSDPMEIYEVVISGEGNIKDSLFQFGGKNIWDFIGEGLATIPKLLFAGILALITLFGAIKLWFTLMKSYVTILLQVIISPVILATAALPGNMKAFGNWVKGILRNVLVFPCAVALINLPQALFTISDGIKLRFPGSLVFEEASSYNSGSIGLDGNYFIIILEIVLIYIASQLPTYLEIILPSNSSSASQKAGEKTKESLTKMPLVGSLFK